MSFAWARVWAFLVALGAMFALWQFLKRTLSEPPSAPSPRTVRSCR